MIRPLLYSPTGLSRNLLELAIAGGFAFLIGAATAVSPFLGIGLVAVMIYVIFALSYPMLNGYVVIIAIGLTSGMERGGLIPLLIPNELALVGSVALLLPYILIVRLRKLAVSGGIIFSIIVLLAGTIFLPVIIHKLRGVPIGFQDMFSLFSPAQFFILFLLYKYLPRNDTDRRNLVWTMLVMTLVIAVIGLLQAANIPFIWQFLYRWYPSPHLTAAAEIGGRVTSLLGAWNSLGTFLMFMLLAVRALQASQAIHMNPRLLGVFGFIFLACMLASGSYASVGGLVFGVLIIETLDKRMSLRFLLAAAVAGLISYVLLQPLIATRAEYQTSGSEGIVPQTVVFRFHVWKDVFFPILARNWLWGVQPIIPANSAWAYAENHYVYVLYRGGTIALASHFIWISGTLFWLFSMFRRKTGIVRALTSTSIAMFIVMTIMALTNEVFTYSGVVDYMWIFLGIIASDEQNST